MKRKIPQSSLTLQYIIVNSLQSGIGNFAQVLSSNVLTEELCFLSDHLRVAKCILKTTMCYASAD
jgi:hypothetical protein